LRDSEDITLFKDSPCHRHWVSAAESQAFGDEGCYQDGRWKYMHAAHLHS